MAVGMKSRRCVPIYGMVILLRTPVLEYWEFQATVPLKAWSLRHLDVAVGGQHCVLAILTAWASSEARAVWCRAPYRNRSPSLQSLGRIRAARHRRRHSARPRREAGRALVHTVTVTSPIELRCFVLFARLTSGLVLPI